MMIYKPREGLLLINLKFSIVWTDPSSAFWEKSITPNIKIFCFLCVKVTLQIPTHEPLCVHGKIL